MDQDSRLQDQVDRWIQDSRKQDAITIPMPRLGTPKVTMDHNTTTTGQSFHPCVTIINVKNILFNLHTIFLSLYRYSTYPSIHSLLLKGEFSLFLFLLFSSFTTFPPSQVCFCDLLQLLCSSLGIRVLICPPFIHNQGWLATQKFFFIY